MTVLPFLSPVGRLPRACGAGRVRLGECQLPARPLGWDRRGAEKGVYRFNKGPTPGPSPEGAQSPAPTEPAQPGRAGGSGTRLGELRGGVLALPGCLLPARAQAPEPCWRGAGRRRPRRQVSTRPGPRSGAAPQQPGEARAGAARGARGGGLPGPGLRAFLNC